MISITNSTIKKTLLLSFTAAIILSGCGKSDAVPSSQTDSSAAPQSSEVIVQDASDIEIENDTSLENETTEAVDTTEVYDDGIPNSDKRVICWGTSLTEGTGGGGVTMPNVLERLSGATVLNYGGYAENTNCIATRSGASEFTLTKDVVIRADDSPVEVEFATEFGDIEKILKYTDAGLNPVTINGIEGRLSRDDEGKYYFERSLWGDETPVLAGTVITPFSVSDKSEDDINIIWTAGNDNLQSTEDIEALIDKIDKMIAFSGSDKYVIVSEMNNHEEVPVTDEVNKMFEEYYNDHFLHLRKYLIEDAFEELNLSPSEEDLDDINKWEIPGYFRNDEVHGNSLYYYIAGEQVYKKCQELGYLR